MKKDESKEKRFYNEFQNGKEDSRQNYFLAGKVEELSAETIRTGKPPHY